MHFISEMGVKSEQEEAALKAIDTTHKYKHDEIEPEQNLFRIEATLTNEETRPTLRTSTILLHHRKGKKDHRSAQCRAGDFMWGVGRGHVGFSR